MPNRELMIVGFMKAKVLSCRYKASAPNTKTTIAETSGISGRLRVNAQDALSDRAVATMKNAVAMRMGSPRWVRIGNFCASHSPRMVVKKNTRPGPSSSRNFKPGLSGLRRGSDGSRSRMFIKVLLAHDLAEKQADYALFRPRQRSPWRIRLRKTVRGRRPARRRR